MQEVIQYLNINVFNLLTNIRVVILDADLIAQIPDYENERQMGYDVYHCWQVKGNCSVCEKDYKYKIEESIYCAFGSDLAFNANSRFSITLKKSIFSFDTAISYKMSVINVGKGDCFTLEIGDDIIIYDTGYIKYHQRIMSSIGSLDKKKRNGIIIVSHKDSDHSGGYEKLVEHVKKKFKPYILYENANAPEEDGYVCNRRAINNTVNFDFGTQIKITCFLQPKNISCSNHRSIVCVVSHLYQGHPWISVLTGDQQLETVNDILNTHYKGKRIFAFQIPHHASKSIYKNNAKLPPALKYIVSGTPKHDINHSDIYNKECQILAIESAAKVCSFPHSFYFTHPYLLPEEARKISESEVTIVKVQQTVSFLDSELFAES